jgi:hypothetical protein
VLDIGGIMRKAQRRKDELMATAKFLFVASMNIDQERENLFNEIYDQEHVPSLLRVPGVTSVRRYRSQPGEVLMGGEKRRLFPDDQPKYHAYYEIAGPQVLLSSDWARAVEVGRWPTAVRPYTSMRRHLLLERISAE